MYRQSLRRRAATLPRGGPARSSQTGNRQLQPDSSQRVPERQAGPVHLHDGRVVGAVRGGVFRKTVRGDKERLRVPPAWSFDAVSIQEALRLGAHSIRLKDVSSGKVYSASMDLFRRKCFRLDRNHGDQRALPLEYWTVVDGGNAVEVQLAMIWD